MATSTGTANMTRESQLGKRIQLTERISHVYRDDGTNFWLDIKGVGQRWATFGPYNSDRERRQVHAAIYVATTCARYAEPPEPKQFRPSQRAAIIIMIATAALAFLGLVHVASAAPRALHVTGNPVADVKADITDANGNAVDIDAKPGDAIIATIATQGANLIADLQAAHDLAAFTDKNGQQADYAAAQCYAALIPIVQLVVNGPPSAQAAQQQSSAAAQTAAAPTATTPQQATGVVTRIEKLRIIRIAINGTPLKNSCAALVQDVQTQVANVLTGAAGIARVLSGVGLVVP